MSIAPRAVARVIRSVLLVVAALLAVSVPASAATWTPYSPPIPAVVTEDAFFGVSCGATTSCTVAGQGYNGLWGALAESGSGTAWAFQTGVTRNPGPKNGLFRGVSCSAATACEAVGSYGTSGGVPAMMAQRQSGTTWTLYNLGIPAGATRAELFGASCRSASWCMAVGNKTVSGVGRPQAMRYNGSAWTDAGATSVSDSTLNGVSCASTTTCVAVGYAGSGPAAQTWNGSTWTATAVPAVPGAYSTANLTGVSCVSATWCLATGSYKNSSGLWRPFADVWNGTAWTTTDGIPWSGNDHSNIEAEAFGISCVSTMECWIVGEGHYGSAITPWGVLWTGTTWAVGLLPTVSGATVATLRSVSCTATNQCAAAGWSLPGGKYAGLTETLTP